VPLSDPNTAPRANLIPETASGPVNAAPRPLQTPSAQAGDTVMSTSRTAQLIPQPVVAGVSAAETVSGQLQRILSEDSPLLQGARARASESSAARGMQNSSMAAGAGERALIETATPIAGADAATHANRTNQNLTTVNQFGLQEAGIQGQLRVGDQNLQNQTQLQEQGIQGQLRVGDQNFRNQTGLQEQQIQGQLRVGDQQGQQQRDLSAQNYQQQVGLLSAETQSRLTLLGQEGAQRLQEIAATSDSQMRLQNAEQAFRLQLEEIATGRELTLQSNAFQNQMSLLISEYGQRANLSTLEQTQQLERQNLQHAQTLEQIAAQATAQQRAEVGPRLQSQYLAAVGERMNASSQEISQIYSTQGLSATQQQTAVANAYQRLQTDLTAISSYYQSSPFWDPAWGQSTQAPGQPAPGGGTQPSGPPIMTPTNPTAPVTPNSGVPDTPFWNNRFPNLIA
jgi:hypothetical protein